MFKGNNLLTVGLLYSVLVMPLILGQAGETRDKATFFESLKEELEDEFAFDIAGLNQTWANFLQAKFELNETASQKAWLVEAVPGSGLFTFSLAGLANFKSKVMEMVEQKNEYLAEKAELRQEMAEAVFNRSVSYFLTVQGNSTGEEAESQPFRVIEKLFGLESESHEDVVGGDNDKVEEDASVNKGGNVDDDEDDDDEFTHPVVSGDDLIDSLLDPPPQAHGEDTDTPITPIAAPVQSLKGEEQETTRLNHGQDTTTTKYPWYRWKALHENPRWNFEVAKRRQDFIKNRIQENIEKRQQWEKFASGRLAGRHTRSMWRAENAASADSMDEAGSTGNQGDILKDIKERLGIQFRVAIRALNDTRNAFIQAKEQMTLLASERAWVKESGWGGLTNFDPQALMAFKAKIAEMVALKNKFVAERASLKQDMLTALGDLLTEHLLRLAESSESEISQLVQGPESTASEAVTSVLAQMVQTGSDGVTDDVMEGLPFARSLMLAAAPPVASSVADHVTDGSVGSGGFAALIVLGVLAVLASVAVVTGVAMRLARRRSPYTRLV